MPVRTRYKI